MSSPPRSCEIQIRVRYAECDPMGYTHHSKYFEYFEIGRTELLRLSGVRYRDLEERGILFVVAKIACRFRKPAHYDDLLTLRVEIARQTRARIDHVYRLYRDDVLLCEAESTLACVDRTGQVIAIPDEMSPTDPNRTPRGSGGPPQIARSDSSAVRTDSRNNPFTSGESAT